jgi:hypothetical protein
MDTNSYKLTENGLKAIPISLNIFYWMKYFRDGI